MNRLVYKTPFNYVHYEHSSENYVTTLHGSGEHGPADGSQITKVENYGYAKLAKNGTDFNFNLIVPQGLPTTAGISDFSKILPGYGNIFQNKLPRTGELYNVTIKKKKLIGIGWSQGAETMLNQLSDPLCQFDAIISIAGKASGSPDYSKMKDIPTLFVHGSNDSSIGIIQSQKFVNSLNATDRLNKATLLVLENGSHSGAMNAAYDPNHEIGKKVMEFIQRIFATDEPEVRVTLSDFYATNDVIYALGSDGKVYSWKAL